jgi:hypothetical protein
MNTRPVVLALSFFLFALFAGPSFAQDKEALKKDLTAVIALQGLPAARWLTSRYLPTTTTLRRARTETSITCT